MNATTRPAGRGASEPGERGAALATLALGAALAAATFASYGWLRGLALLGFDAYPLIAASRVDSLGGALGTFGDELMAGRYPDGRFYRPLTHLTFAFDAARAGLQPVAYHTTDLALGACAAWLVALVARALAARGGASAIGAALAGLAAGLAFLLHPVQLEVLPFAARRADSLALALALGAALAVGRGRAALPFTLGLLAPLAKETGFLALPCGALLWRAERRAERPWRSLLPLALGVGAALVLRTAVLDGLGGHTEGGAAAWTSLGARTRALAGALTGGSPGAAAWGALGVAFGLGALVLAGAARHAGALVGLFALCATLTLASGRAHAWYAYLWAAPVMVLLGRVVGAAATPGTVPRVARGLAALAAVALAAGGLAAGPARGESRAALEAASRVAAAQVAAVEALAPGAHLGGRARLDGWRPWVSTGSGTVLLHAPYSLRAILELSGVQVPIEIIPNTPETATTPRATDRWTILLEPKPLIPR